MEGECCENCRYSKPKFADSTLTCRRVAPAPYNALVFHFGDLIREIGWIIHAKETGTPPGDDSDLRNETTEAGDYAVWPEVERDDWCGEWRAQNAVA